MADRPVVLDMIGVGIGPFNLGLAALLGNESETKAMFFDRKPQFSWHPGMLLDGTTLQVPFFADLVTMADPTSPYSFLNYLKEQGRLYAFYFLERFHIPRTEYDDYCRWAAERLSSCRFGYEVTSVTAVPKSDVLAGADYEEGTLFAVEVKDVRTRETSLYYAHDLVLGAGSVPQVGEAFRRLRDSGAVFHSAEFAGRASRCREARSITVVGSGQSAAEVFLQLLNEQQAYGYRLDWFTRSPGFFPMEYSKLGLEHFSPDYTAYFYGLPQARRDEVRSKQHLLYKGISAATIAAIYDRLYELTVGGRQLPVRLLAHTEIVSAEALDLDKGYRLDLHHLEQETSFTHVSEIVILATGYSQPVPACLMPLQAYVEWDEQGRYQVSQDYRLKLDRRISGRIYIQNAELHTHGIGAPDLGLGAHRNSVILNSMLGEVRYPVSDRNVFQQFGVR